MRVAIRERLIAQLPELGGRVYEAFVPTAKTEKPYAVVKRGPEAKTKMSRGFNVPFEIWLYTDPTSQTVLDKLETKVVKAVYDVDLTTTEGFTFGLEYQGASGDFYDTDWMALTRRMDFRTARIW